MSKLAGSPRKNAPARAIAIDGAFRRTPPLWVMRRDQLKALTSAIRHDIMDHLVAREPLSVRDLALSLQRKPTAIYTHLRRLQKVNLVVSIQVAQKRGRPALLFRPVAPLVRLARAPNDARNRPILARIAKTMSSQAAKEYGKAFQRPGWVIDGPARNHWVFRCMTAPSPQRLVKINGLLDQLAELIWTPDPNPGRLLSVTWLLSPIGTATDKNSLRSRPGRSRSRPI